MGENDKSIITIVVQRKHGPAIIEAALAADAPGITYFYARGTGVRQKMGFWGRFIDGEKQIIILAVPAFKADMILDSIIKTTGLDKPGLIFAYIQPALRVEGNLAN